MKLAIRLLINRLTSALGQVPFRIPVKGLFAGKATEIGFLLHSIAPLAEYLEALSTKRLPQLLPKYQPGQLWPTGFLLDPCQQQRVYDVLTDDANETNPLPPPTLRAFTPRSADETEVMMAPSTLPESVTEVLQ